MLKTREYLTVDNAEVKAMLGKDAPADIADRLVTGTKLGDPAVRAQLVKRFRGRETKECPFANLPEARSGRWGAGLTKAKMVDCRWLKPVLVGQFEFWIGRARIT